MRSAYGATDTYERELYPLGPGIFGPLLVDKFDGFILSPSKAEGEAEIVLLKRERRRCSLILCQSKDRERISSFENVEMVPVNKRKESGKSKSNLF